MDITTSYDPNGVLREPTMILTTRSGRKLGALPAGSIVFHGKENSASELSFDVRRCDVEDRNFWNKIKDFKLVYVREYDQFFEIYVDVKDGDELVRHVDGTALGYAELSQILLRDVEINTEDDIARDDYEPTIIYDAENSSASLLDRILDKAPHYSVGHVDSSLARMQRTFTFDSSIADAINEVAEEIQCIVKLDASWDSENQRISRKVNLYDLQDFCRDCGERGEFTVCPKCGSINIQQGYGEDTSIFVSVDNIADDVEYSVDTGSVKNCFRLEGGDDLMTAAIAACNLNGSSYIWYVSDDQREDMSDELRAKLNQYDELCDYYQDEYEHTFDADLRTAYNSIVSYYADYDESIVELPASATGHEELMEAEYNAIDLRMFLEHTLMPQISPSIPTAAEWCDYLDVNFDIVAIANYTTSVTESIVTKAIVSAIQAKVGAQYKITTSSVVYTAGTTQGTWTGVVTLTDIGDDTNTDSTGTLTVTVDGDYENYVKQKINQILASADKEQYGISNLLSLDNADLEDDLKEYSLGSLSIIMDSCQGVLDILIQQGASEPGRWEDEDYDMYTQLYLPYRQMFTTIRSAYEERESQIATVNSVQAEITDTVAVISSALNFEEFIGQQLWLEFAMYRREDTYKNDNYISDGLDNAALFTMAKQFVDTARKDIIEAATAQHSISASLKNLMTMQEFRSVLDQFGLGNWIRLKIDEDIYRLRVVDYEIDYENPESMNIEFSDVKVGYNGASDFDSIIERAASMSTSYGTVSRQAEKGGKSMSMWTNFVDNGLALTNSKIVNADNQDIQIDRHGILGREYLPDTGDYDNRQIKMINRGIYMTDDNWQTSKAAVGEFTFWNPSTQQYETAHGVIADKLVGNLILGHDIGVYNEDGSVTLGNTGFVITTKSENNTVMFTIRREVTVNDVTSYEDIATIDSEGLLTLNGTVRLNMTASEKANPFTNDTSFNEFYSSVVANADQIQEQFTMIDGNLDVLNGEIRRGFIDVNGTRYFGIVVSSKPVIQSGADSWTPSGEVNIYHEINTEECFGLYTSTGWQFWKGSQKLGWYDTSDGQLHVVGIQIEDILDVNGWGVRGGNRFGIKQIGV